MILHIKRGKAALEALALQRKAISEDKFMLDSDQKKAEEVIDAQSEAIRMQTIALRENKFARSEVGNIFGDTSNTPEAILRANQPKTGTDASSDNIATLNAPTAAVIFAIPATTAPPAIKVK